MVQKWAKTGISIHPPRVGRDRALRGWSFGIVKFQSTLPVWGGTSKSVLVAPGSLFQSTLPVWGGTYRRLWLHDGNYISIHPPRVGRDIISMDARTKSKKFQSTLPVWGGTGFVAGPLVIHQFQSTLPVWGGTGYRRDGYISQSRFQSTLPVWGGTSI